MRRKMARIMVLALAAYLGGCGPASGPKEFGIPRMDRIIIDGKADDWGADGFRTDVLAPVDQEIRSPTDHGARARLGWDERGLLMLLTVSDDAGVEHAVPEEMWRHDSVEIFLAPEPGSADMCQWLVGPGTDPDRGGLRWHLSDNRQDSALKKAPAKLVAARTKTDTGYILEALLPLSAVGITPAEGRRVALQFYVNDADEPGMMTTYNATWYPGDGTSKDTGQMYSVRLGRAAGVGPAVRVGHRFDGTLLQMGISVLATARMAGRTVAITESGRTLASKKLTDDGFGRSMAKFLTPAAPAGKPYGQLTVKLAGRAVGAIDVPDGDRRRAEAFLFATPSARPSVFSGEKLPDVRFEHPFRIRALIGPYRIRTTYYDRDFRRVTRAATPGRYGAIAEIIPEVGRPSRRFLTLFRLPRRLNWGGHDLQASVVLPPEMGVKPESIAAHSKAFRNYLKWQIVEGADRSSDAAVVLAALHETKPGDPTDDFYTDPRQRDRQWWVGLKRKLYGLDRRYPGPFVCPRPMAGKPAVEIRAGSPKQAGMKADAAAKIDAVLTEWAGDTDQAFAVCVARHGVIVLHKAYGVRDGKPMTVTTTSWMASLTKLMSGSLMMMLVDQGLIDLDDRADKYLPPLREVSTNKPLTLRHLYTHTNGMDWHWGDYANDMEERITTMLGFYRVGEKYAYNGTGMALGCKILEGVSGESLPAFYRKHLLGPLGCEHTIVGNASSDAASVPLDMARIGQMLLNKGAYGKQRFFSEKTFEQMLPQRLTKVLGPDTEAVRGIGTSLFDQEGLGAGTFAHGAASGATLRIDPVNDLVIVMTRDAAGTNMEKHHPKFIDAILEGIAD